MAYDESKFAEFNRLLKVSTEHEIDVVLIHHPEVMGDDYQELVENLNRLSDAGLALRILPREGRYDKDEGHA